MFSSFAFEGFLTTGVTLEKSLHLNDVNKYAVYQLYHQSLNESKHVFFFFLGKKIKEI